VAPGNHRERHALSSATHPRGRILSRCDLFIHSSRAIDRNGSRRRVTRASLARGAIIRDIVEKIHNHTQPLIVGHE
jgi:hypothetical protein